MTAHQTLGGPADPRALSHDQANDFVARALATAGGHLAIGRGGHALH